MKKTLFLLSLMLCASLAPIMADVAYNLTPYPKTLTNRTTFCQLPRQLVVGVDAELGDSTMKDAQAFVDALNATMTGTTATLQHTTEGAFVQISRGGTNTTVGNEGYKLTINSEAITLQALGEKGFAYGLLSIKKMLPPHVCAGQKAAEAQDYSLRCVTITDNPRWQYRGFMLDCSRHFFDVKEIKRMLDVMALYKMNAFHWHLTDDQGWRAEIKKYPKLTTIGATAPDSRITDFENGTYWLGHEYGPYFYTQEEMKDVVAYAAERGIEVIPEIEMLGHSVAALCAYPEFSCNPSAKRTVWTNGGISSDVVNVADPKAVQFYKDIVDELCEVFPGRYFHIGGDECPTSAWENNKMCQDFLKEKGYTNYRQIQSWFTNVISGYIKEKGKRTIVWNESITAGGSDLDLVKEHNPIIMCWYPAQGGAQKAASIGLDAIITEYHSGVAGAASGAGGYYINRKLSNHPSEPDGAGGGDDTVEGCYKYVPQPNATSTPTVIGVQGTFWCEWVGVPEYLEYLALPRLMAVAEAGWTPENKKNWSSFVDRMVIDTQILDAWNINYSRHWMPGYVAPKVETTEIIADGVTEYSFNNQSKDRPIALADDNGTLNGQASATTNFVLEPATKADQYYIKSCVSGKYLYASASTSGTMVTLDTKKTAWAFDWETMPKYVAICHGANTEVALNNNVNNATHIRLFAHGTGNGASFYSMKLEKRGETEGVVNVDVNDNDNDNCYDLQGRIVPAATRGLYIQQGRKVIK
ncbi:MAG: beta-N-acetylhexosaminidase [Bacteroidaceae bacterium]|nr:beta-N-acetylhexosaminidase [Bacteroidaceae bacterium]